MNTQAPYFKSWLRTWHYYVHLLTLDAFILSFYIIITDNTSDERKK